MTILQARWPGGGLIVRDILLKSLKFILVLHLLRLARLHLRWVQYVSKAASCALYIQSLEKCLPIPTVIAYEDCV